MTVPRNVLIENVLGWSDISKDLGVVGTNMLLALIALLILLVATNMFNETLESNGPEISLLVSRATGPFAGVAAFMGWLSDTSEDSAIARRSFWLSLIKPALLVLTTASIYALLEPDFGFNSGTLVLITALFTGIALATFLYEGGQVWWASHHYQTPASLRIFPLAIVIALGSVFLTRITDLHPGVVFGFVTAAMVFPHRQLSKREEGLIVAVPLLTLLLVSAIAFLLIDPLREFSAGHPSVWATLPETIAVALFVGGAESALIILLPFKFNDGENIWSWSKRVWLLLAFPAMFMFIHVILNEEDLGELVGDDGQTTLIVVSLVIFAVAFATWLYFRARQPKEHL